MAIKTNVSNSKFFGKMLEEHLFKVRLTKLFSAVF